MKRFIPIISAIILLVLFPVAMVIWGPDQNTNDGTNEWTNDETNEWTNDGTNEWSDDKSNLSSDNSFTEELGRRDYIRGEENRKQGKNFAAITNYNRAIDQNSEHIDAYYGRGLANEDIGEYKAAIFDFDNVIRLDPEHVNAYIQRGWTKYHIVHQIKNRTFVPSLVEDQVHTQVSEAISDFDKAIHLSPDTAYAYYSRAIMKYRMKKYLDAISDFDTSIHHDPDDAYAYYYRGLCRQNIVKYNKGTFVLNLEAKQDWQTALKIAKRNGYKELQNDIKSCLSGDWYNK